MKLFVNAFTILVNFLSKNIEDGHKIEKEKDTATVAVLGVIASTIFSSYSILYMTVFINYYLAFMEAFSAFLAILAMLVYRKYQNYEKVLLVYCFSTYFATLSSCYFSGGISSPHLYWTIAIVLGSELFGTKLIAKFSFIMMIFGFSIFSIISITKTPLPPTIFTGTFAEIYTIATLFFISITCLSFARLYSSILKKSLKELNLKNERIERFVGILCHDIANPLHVINGRADIGLKRKLPNEKHLLAYKRIKESSLIIEEILMHVRQIEDLNNGESSLKISSVNLYEVINEATLEIKEKIHSRGIHLSLDIQTDRDLRIFADQNTLKDQVIISILENAIKFSENDSTITIQTNLENKTVHLIIQDQGVGIDSNISDKIFDIDVKTSTVGLNGEQGTGFGLPIAYGYVKEFNGDINVRTKHISKNPQEHGTSFDITLKLAG